MGRGRGVGYGWPCMVRAWRVRGCLRPRCGDQRRRATSHVHSVGDFGHRPWCCPILVEHGQRQDGSGAPTVHDACRPAYGRSLPGVDGHHGANFLSCFGCLVSPGHGHDREPVHCQKPPSLVLVVRPRSTEAVSGGSGIGAGGAAHVTDCNLAPNLMLRLFAILWNAGVAAGFALGAYRSSDAWPVVFICGFACALHARWAWINVFPKGLRAALSSSRSPEPVRIEGNTLKGVGPIRFRTEAAPNLKRPS